MASVKRPLRVEPAGHGRAPVIVDVAALVNGGKPQKVHQVDVSTMVRGSPPARSATALASAVSAHAVVGADGQNGTAWSHAYGMPQPLTARKTGAKPCCDGCGQAQTLRPVKTRGSWVHTPSQLERAPLGGARLQRFSVDCPTLTFREYTAIELVRKGMNSVSWWNANWGADSCQDLDRITQVAPDDPGVVNDAFWREMNGQAGIVFSGLYYPDLLQAIAKLGGVFPSPDGFLAPTWGTAAVGMCGVVPMVGVLPFPCNPLRYRQPPESLFHASVFDPRAAQSAQPTLAQFRPQARVLPCGPGMSFLPAPLTLVDAICLQGALEDAQSAADMMFPLGSPTDPLSLMYNSYFTLIFVATAQRRCSATFSTEDLEQLAARTGSLVVAGSPSQLGLVPFALRQPDGTWRMNPDTTRPLYRCSPD